MKESTAMELMKRREDLIARIARERNAIAQNGTSIRPLVHWAGKLKDVAHFLKKRPAYLLLPALLPAAVLTAGRPRRLLGMVISGIGFWRLARKWRRLQRDL